MVSIRTGQDTPVLLADMNTVIDAVAGGFRVAGRRLHLLLFDMAAKLLWLILTLGVFGFGIAAFLARFRPPPAALGGDVGGLLLGAQVAAAVPALVRTMFLLAGASFVLWSLLEAFTRSRIFLWTWGDRPGSGGTFGRFLASGVLRRLCFGLTALVLTVVLLGPGLASSSGQWWRAWPEVQWAVIAGVLLLLMLAFALMLLDTLMRCDAVEALGTDLGAITAAVAMIGFFEVTLRAAALAGTVVLMNLIPPPVVLVVGVPVIGVGLSVVHSYLLLVRYSAIGIMRTEFRGEVRAHYDPGYSV